jgi:hypothetical protein
MERPGSSASTSVKEAGCSTSTYERIPLSSRIDRRHLLGMNNKAIRIELFKTEYGVRKMTIYLPDGRSIISSSMGTSYITAEGKEKSYRWPNGGICQYNNNHNRHGFQKSRSLTVGLEFHSFSSGRRVGLEYVKF